MCSKPNAEDAEACEFCGARIKPLFIGSEPEEPGREERPVPAPPEDQAVDVPQEGDWLNRMRGGMEEEGVDQARESDEADGFPERGSTDLLGRFRGLGLADGEEEADEPSTELHQEPIEQVDSEETVPAEPERGSTDLLGRFRGLGLAADEDITGDELEDSTPEHVDEVEEIEAEQSVDPERGSTDLLGRLSDLGLSEEGGEVAEEPSFLTPDDPLVEELADIQFDSTGLDEVEREEGDLVWNELAETDVEAEIAATTDEFTGDESDEAVPDWLTRVRERQSSDEDVEAADKAASGEDVDWFSGLSAETIASELVDGVDPDELEKAPPFLDGDADELIQEDRSISEPFIDGPSTVSEPVDESESLKDLFRELESEVAAVERIVGEERDDRIVDEATSRVDLDDLFAPEVEDDSLLEEIEISERETPFQPLEIEKGTSPLQDLFEELDKKLQTGELPPLEPDVIPLSESDEDVDAALEKLLEEFDDSERSEVGVFLEEDVDETTREVPIEEIFTDFKVSPLEEPVGDSEEVEAEDISDEDLAALEQVFGGIELPVDEEEDEFEGAFDGVEAPSREEITGLEEAFAGVDQEDDEDAISLEEAFADFETPSEDDIETIDEAFAEVGKILGEGEQSEDLIEEQISPPSEEEIAAIEQLFGDVDVEQIGEPDDRIDSGVLRDITGEEHPDAKITEPPPAEEVVEKEKLEPDAELDLEFEAAEIELDSLAPGSDQLAPAIDLEEGEEAIDLVPTPPVPPDGEVPISTTEDLEEYTPSWLQEGVSEGEMTPRSEGELPHVPALITEDDDGGFEDVGEDFLAAEVSMGEMPTWLQDLGADIDDEDLEEEEPEVELARAKLPPWLEAMRPIETFKAEPEVEEVEEEEITEAAGPLAGLRGVLLAEPVVAMPRSASTGVAALDVTERQYTNTEILRQMIGEEELEQTRPEARAAPLPVVRWIVSLLLLLAVILPGVLGFPAYSEPYLGPRELNPFISLMDSIPLNEPTLLIFDYEPGFSAEMDAVAGAMVDDLIGRRQPIVTLSSRPTGSLLADRMILRTGSNRELVNGVDYLHLGYLSGGATGIKLFASSPRSSLVDGFRMPEEPEGVTTWTSPILNDVQQLSDFSAIAIITSGTETARNWIEQFTPYIADTPLVSVVSAGAEPMIRPYFEADEPQVQALLSGIQAGIKYEVWNGTLSDATQSWNSFGTALFVAELILVAGGIYGGARWFLQRRVNAEE